MIRSSAVLGAMLLLATLPAHADMLDTGDVATMIVGKTFHGVNESDEAFWIWHEGGADGGAFRAKFQNDRDGTVFGEGFWRVDDDEICWTWTSWNDNRFCYDRFDYDGETLAMTRTDGVVHAGRLNPGNGEGL